MRVGTDALTDIRLLQRSDKAPIERILVATGVFTEAEVAVALELIDVVLDKPAQRDYDIRTAVDDEGRVAGYYCIGPTPVTDGTFDLYWIAVAPEFHNRGIGAQLLAHAEANVRGLGGRLIIAQTSSQEKYEPTRRFYIRNAYDVVARITDYYRPGDDLVIFGKYVSQSGRF